MNAKLYAATLMVGVLVLSACSSEDDPAPSSPIITISNTWGEEGVSNHDFSLSSGDDGESAGSFTGEETTPANDTFDLVGTWSYGRVTFTVDRDGGVTYTAQFSEDGPDRLVFESDEGQLVLVRGG